MDVTQIVNGPSLADSDSTMSHLTDPQHGIPGPDGATAIYGPDSLQDEEVFEDYPADQVQSLARRLGEAKHYLSSAAAMVDEALAQLLKDTTFGDEEGHHIAIL